MDPTPLQAAGEDADALAVVVVATAILGRVAWVWSMMPSLP
jgi:hypothetical protein